VGICPSLPLGYLLEYRIFNIPFNIPNRIPPLATLPVVPYCPDIYFSEYLYLHIPTKSTFKSNFLFIF
jgi:hypothetical protein